LVWLGLAWFGLVGIGLMGTSKEAAGGGAGEGLTSLHAPLSLALLCCIFAVS